MRISDWSSDVCSSDLRPPRALNKCASRSVEEIAFDPGGWEFPVDDLSRRQRSSHDSRNVAAHPAIYSRAIREPCDGGINLEGGARSIRVGEEGERQNCASYGRGAGRMWTLRKQKGK